jgi:hypothetical protein
VADDTEWTCFVDSKTVPMVHNGKYIQGTSKHFPLKFVFYQDYSLCSKNTIFDFLRAYAINTNSVLFDVTVSEKKAPNSNMITKFIVEGSFYDNSTSGHFQVCSEVFGNAWFITFTIINSKLLDEHSRTQLYDSVHCLITPLFTPKALGLWLEAIESGECSE